MRTLSIVAICFVGSVFCSVTDLKPYDEPARMIFTTEDKNGDGIMDLNDIRICVTDLKPYDELARTIFTTEDKDGDGIMDMNDIHTWFDSYDTNRDGRMTRHEYTEGVCSDTPQLYQLGHYLYDKYDMDHDHHVDRHDWENFLKDMDSGNDGSVTEDEFVAYWVAMFEFVENAPTHGQTHAHGHSACH